MSVGQELRRRLAGWFWFSVSHAIETLARLSVIIRRDLLWKICSQGGLLVWMASWCWPNGNPLQYSCLENPMDRGNLRAPVHGAAGVRHDWATFTTIGRRAQSLATLDVSVRLLEYLTACAGFPARKWQNREKAPSPMTKPQKTQRNYSNTLTVTKPALFGVQGDGYRAWRLIAGPQGAILKAAYLNLNLRSCEYAVEALVLCLEDEELFYPQRMKATFSKRQEWGCEPKSSAGRLSVHTSQNGLRAAQTQSPL